MKTVPDNIWAFLLFVLASALAILSALWHDKDLMVFAGGVTMTASALFHVRSDKPQG